MDDIDKELRPVLAKLITLKPDNNYQHEPEVIQLYDWLIQPERTVEEFHHVVGPLHNNVYQSLNRYARGKVLKTEDDSSMDELRNFLGDPNCFVHLFILDKRNKHIYILRTAAEALAARCPVLEGRWEQIAWHIFVPLSEKKFEEYGNVSSNLSNWIIEVVGNPDLCPNVDLRYQILLLYKTLVEINHVNYMQGLESFMSVCCSIDSIRVNDDDITKTKNILKCMMLFKKERARDKTLQCQWVNVDPRKEFLYKFGITVAEKLRSHRSMRQHIHLHDISHDYSMGIKTITEPRELLSLTQLIRYIGNLAHLEYVSFKDGGEYNLQKLSISSDGLLDIMRGFQTALQDPMLLSTTAESIMDVLEAVLILVHHAQGGTARLQLSALVNVDLLLEEFIYYRDDDGMDAGPIGWEIVTKYKSRICFVKSQISQGFLTDDSTIYALLYKMKC